MPLGPTDLADTQAGFADTQADLDQLDVPGPPPLSKDSEDGFFDHLAEDPDYAEGNYNSARRATGDFQPLLQDDGSPVSFSQRGSGDFRRSLSPQDPDFQSSSAGSPVSFMNRPETEGGSSLPEDGFFDGLVDDDDDSVDIDSDKHVQFDVEEDEVRPAFPIRKKTAVNFFSNWRDCLEVSDHSQQVRLLLCLLLYIVCCMHTLHSKICLVC